MRASITIAAAIAGFFLAVPSTHATPYQPLVEFEKSESDRNASLELRQNCLNPCGWHNQYCCGTTEKCITTAGNIAVCTQGGSGGGGGGGAAAGADQQGWHMFTTTFVVQGPTTVTSTGSYQDAQTPAPGGSPVSCPQGSNQCGAVCCGPTQSCVQAGKCVDGTGSAFIRPTSNAVSTATQTGAATTIVPLGTALPTNEPATAGTGTGLSAGAIAGIVIGVLVGLFILFIILACLCCKGIIDGILTLLGCRKKRRVEETTIIEEHHSHHGSSRPQRRTWFGVARPGRTDVEVKKKKSSSGGGLLGGAAFLGTLAVILGLKRRHDRKSEKVESSYGSVSYYSYEDDYTTSASSASSDRRSRSHRGSARGSRR